MSYSLAPYNDSMRLGQGFNSYKQQACIDHAVKITASRVNNPQLVSQVVAYSARVVQSLSDVVDGANGSYYSSIKKGTVEITGSTTTVNENAFKTADLNAVISVKVTNQGSEVVTETAEFQALKNGSTYITKGADFNDMYGDSYISGFLTGGEFTGIVSIKVIDRSKVETTVNKIKSALASQKESPDVVFNPIDSQMASNLLSVMQDTETTIAVSWMGGGQVKPAETLWDLESVLAAAAAFPARVAECPQRTWAILTKYKANRSFVELAQKSAFELLEYDQVHSYTAELFDQYMDYKVLLSTLQDVIENLEAYETAKFENALEPHLPTLLSVKALFRQEQAKIARAVEALSKDPGILLRASSLPSSALPPAVATIIDNALGFGKTTASVENLKPVTNPPAPPATVPSVVQTDTAAPVPSVIQSNAAAPAAETITATAAEQAGATPPTTQIATPANPDTGRKQAIEVDFSKLIPSEVWTRVLPVRKAGGVIEPGSRPRSGAQGVPSLDGFLFADSDPLRDPYNSASLLCPDAKKLSPVALAWARRYNEFAKSYMITAPLGTGSAVWPVHLFDQCCQEPQPRPKKFNVAFNNDGFMTCASIEYVSCYGPLRALAASDALWSINNTDIDEDIKFQSLVLRNNAAAGSVDEKVSKITIEAGRVDLNTTAPIRLTILTTANRLLDWQSSKYSELRDPKLPTLEANVPVGYTFHSFWFQQNGTKTPPIIGALGIVWEKL